MYDFLNIKPPAPVANLFRTRPTQPTASASAPSKHSSTKKRAQGTNVPKLENSALSTPTLADSEHVQERKQEAAEKLARREKAIRQKREADELARVSNVASVSGATVSHKTANTQRPQTSSKVGASKLADCVAPTEEQPAKRKKLMIGAQKRAMEEAKKLKNSSSASTMTVQKTEKRKLSELFSDDDEPVRCPPARKTRPHSPTPKRHKKVEVVRGEKDEKAQRARKAPEQKEEKTFKQKIQTARKEAAVVSEEEPLFHTTEVISSWFAGKYPQVCEVPKEILKVYREKDRDLRILEISQVLEEGKRKEELKRQHHARVEKDFERGVMRAEKGHKNWHRIMDMEYENQTPVAMRRKGPVSTSTGTPSDAKAELASDSDSAVRPLKQFATPAPPTPWRDSSKYDNYSKHAAKLEIHHKMADHDVIKERMAKHKKQISDYEAQKKEHASTEAMVNDAIGRRGKADPEMLEDIKKTTEKLDTKFNKAVDNYKTAHRSIDKVSLGELIFPTWYSSNYLKEFVHPDLDKKFPKTPVVETLYCCNHCFAYTTDLEQLAWHSTQQCRLRFNVPGEKIYEHGTAGLWSVWQVNGETDRSFCQCLSLFAKLFLADKSVSYHTELFDYFLLVHKDPKTGNQQIVGFFSKEKNSYDGNNLACICIFPPWQNLGLGKMMMGVSYEISRMEKNPGGPERPFSELGEKSYRKYWQAELARWILSHGNTDKKKGCLMVDIERISRETCILERDCIDTINSMNLDLLPKYAGPIVGDQPVVLDKEKVRQWVQANNISLDRVVDANGFIKQFKSKAEKEAEDDDD